MTLPSDLILGKLKENLTRRASAHGIPAPAGQMS